MLVAPDRLSADLIAKSIGKSSVTVNTACGPSITYNFTVQSTRRGVMLPALPNPADTELVLTVPPDVALRNAVLYNAQGVAVRQVPGGAPRPAIDVRALPEGLYYLLLQDASGGSTRQTVEVRH